MNTLGEFSLSMVTEEKSPKTIESARKKLSEILKHDEDTKNLKIIALTFLEEIEHPESKQKMKVISIYVEHKNEKSGTVYYYPYINGKNRVEFMVEQNFNNKIEKLIL